MDPITDRDVKRLELYTFTIAVLYWCALFLPVVIILVYFYNIYWKTRDVKNKFDERIFAATQMLTVGVTLYVCLMPFILAVHSEIVSKTIYEKGDAFGAQNNAIWLVHGNIFRIMILLFFRLMAIDMTLFQFIDWFLEQFEEDEEGANGAATPEDIEAENRLKKELEEELKISKTPERRREIENSLEELNNLRSNSIDSMSKQNASAPETSASKNNEPTTKPALQLPIQTKTSGEAKTD